MCGKRDIALEVKREKQLLEIYGNSCMVCKAESYDEIHHLDKNPMNNHIQNIILICHTCHYWVHLYKDIKTWQNARKMILGDDL